MAQTWLMFSFVLFSTYTMTNIAQNLTMNGKSIDGVLGIWIRDHRGYVQTNPLCYGGPLDSFIVIVLLVAAKRFVYFTEVCLSYLDKGFNLVLADHNCISPLKYFSIFLKIQLTTVHYKQRFAMAVAQLVEWLLLIPEVRGSNPIIGKKIIENLPSSVWKDENKEKEAMNLKNDFFKKTFRYKFILKYQRITSSWNYHLEEKCWLHFKETDIYKVWLFA